MNAPPPQRRNSKGTTHTPTKTKTLLMDKGSYGNRSYSRTTAPLRQKRVLHRQAASSVAPAQPVKRTLAHIVYTFFQDDLRQVPTSRCATLPRRPLTDTTPFLVSHSNVAFVFAISSAVWTRKSRPLQTKNFARALGRGPLPHSGLNQYVRLARFASTVATGNVASTARR